MNSKKLLTLTALTTVLGAIGFLYNNTTGEPNYARECARKPQCQTILDAMEEGVGQDALAGIEPLTPAHILDHASHRFGYGLSTVDQSFLPDRMTAQHLPKIAWIIYSQITGEDPTLEGLQNQIQQRRVNFGIYTSEAAVVRQRFRCFNDDRLKINGQLNLTNMPTSQLVQITGVIIDEQLAIADRNQRTCGFPTTGAVQALKAATLQRELLEAALGTQYFNGSVTKDLQMSYDKVIHEFWFNHFNIDTNKPLIAAFGQQSFENTITQNQFTNFRQLLGAVIKHPGMLQYLDNDSNSAISIRDTSGRIIDQIASNQNLGRELLELHTFGIGPAEGQVSPYNQVDVEVTSLVFTGHTVFEGAYAFRQQRAATRISYLNKFFTQRSSAARPLFFNKSRLAALDALDASQRLDYVLDQLAQHSVVQRNICGKFSHRFVAKGRQTENRAIFQKCLQEIQANTSASGDNSQLRRMYFSVAQTPQFWTRVAARKTLGNPLEIVVKNVRTLGMFHSALIAGGFSEKPISRLANFMQDSVLDMGLSYREFGDPTGYEMYGPEWLSQGYLINHARLSFEYAHLNKILGISSRERSLTLTGLQQQALINLSNPADVAMTVYRPARGIASISKLSADQSNDIIAIGDISASSNELDMVDGRPSINETVYSLLKAHANEMRK